MSNFWRRLSRRERALVILTGVILLIFIGKYALVTPFLTTFEALSCRRRASCAVTPPAAAPGFRRALSRSGPTALPPRAPVSW